MHAGTTYIRLQVYYIQKLEFFILKRYVEKRVGHVKRKKKGKSIDVTQRKDTHIYNTMFNDKINRSLSFSYFPYTHTQNYRVKSSLRFISIIIPTCINVKS